MVTEFNTIQHDASITEAVRLIYNGKVRETGFKTVCTMVTNHFGELVGIVSMFDILYHLRPPIMNYLGDSIHVGTQELESYVKQFKGMTVEQVMNSPVKYVSPGYGYHGDCRPNGERQMSPAACCGRYQGHRDCISF